MACKDVFQQQPVNVKLSSNLFYSGRAAQLWSRRLETDYTSDVSGCSDPVYATSPMVSQTSVLNSGTSDS